MVYAAKRLGLISDTHNLLRPEALAALRGCDLILHAGDIGNLSIIQKLSGLAPVVAIRGNNDTDPWCAKIPETVVVQAGEFNIYMIHDLSQLDLDPAAAGFHIVLSGHTHTPDSFERNRVFYINPGSAGPRRFSLPVTVARLDLEIRPWIVESIPLVVA
jgi:putative phosphoesterase